ncbi:MAG: Rne/Rng family ribonuclease [Armatimonadetes bacterium]|nr:Rne/Rng family ribonuclease [Armatimonadota bacterium]
METDIIVNVAAPRTRVAIMQDGQLAELLLEGEERVVGNIYMGRVANVVPGLDAAFMDCGIEKNVFLHVSDAMETEPSRAQMRRKMESFPPIKEVVKNGDEFLVQVTKGPVDAKGARASRRLALPSRNLVLMADGRGKVGVSKKIEDEAERARLRELAVKTKPEGFGMIVRTRAEGAERKDFEADVKFLMKLWRSIQARARQEKAPALIYEDLTLVFEVLRDVFDPNVRNFVVDDKITYDKVLNLLNSLAPELRPRVKLYREQEPIFAHYQVEAEIERALRRTVGLPKGGYIAIDATEALTAIDVNSGKFTSTKRLEDTVLRTNLDAATEIARQLRLRDIGGIIVIDFIDMDNPRHRRQVTAALKTALEEDRMRTRIMHITRLGLIEMTRKRTGQSLTRQMQVNCPCCEGTGRILSPETVASRLAEAVRQAALGNPNQALLVEANPEVILFHVGSDGAIAARTEERLGCPIYFRGVMDMHPEHFEIKPNNDRNLKRTHLPFKKGQKITLQATDAVPGPGDGLVALHEGYLILVEDTPDETAMPLQVRLTEVERSYAIAVPVQRNK